jgi:hypothetical protein
MGNYEIAVLAGWALAMWALCSVLFSASAKFSSLGKSKWRWFLIALTAFIPYVGFIAVLFYVFKVRVHFPSRPGNPGGSIPAFTGPGAGVSQMCNGIGYRSLWPGIRMAGHAFRSHARRSG